MAREMADGVSPKDRFITVYGRNPVLEALANDDLHIDKVLLAERARGPHVQDIVAAAHRRGVALQRVSAERVKKLAGNGKQDQGVCADVVAPRMRPLERALAEGLSGPVLVLDGITTPANVGMILRTATAAGFSGIVVPRRGVASLDPLVVKASAGVAFVAPVLKTATAANAVHALRDRGFHVVGLRSHSAHNPVRRRPATRHGIPARQRDSRAGRRGRGSGADLDVNTDGERGRVAQRRRGRRRAVLRGRTPRQMTAGKVGRPHLSRW